MEEPDQRERTLLVHSSHLHQRWWPVLHSTCDSSPRIKLHTRSSLQHSEGLGSSEDTIWVYVQVWLEEGMMYFKTVCGSKKINPQVLFYDGHGRNFDDRDIHILRSHHIKPLFLKAGESGNDQPNDNETKLKLKGVYGQARINCQRQHGTIKFTNAHINSVLVEIWRDFQFYSSPIIINAFRGKICYPSPLCH